MPNLLATESSPYLLQHAENPVSWMPWGEQALTLARESDKPILLSIGYSTCHWCHVMARESFEDQATAAVMNQHFVNIKVDREERPDLDKTYQTALQLINPQGGGWPLTMFLDPQTLLPFYGGTYFPEKPRYQLPGFQDLLLRLAEVYENQKDELTEQGNKMLAALAQLNPPTMEAELNDLDVLQSARDHLGQQYDHQEGGFGKAPKFPMPTAIDRLLRHWAFARKAGGNDKEGLDMAMITLTQIARGGIYDHVGGGFFRYATDQKWMVPHFEKMLYDNAQLLSSYSTALTLGPDQLFSDVIRETIAWLQTDMAHPDGAYYAAVDADSEGEEGNFYVWRREQLKKILTPDEYLLVETLYGLDKPANFSNKWNLHRYDSWRSVVQRLSLEPSQANDMLTAAKKKMYLARSQRIAPSRDNKVLSAWNGLLMSGIACAAERLAEPEWIGLTQNIADFLRTYCWRDGILYATYQNDTAKHHGYLDDYANVLNGLINLLQVSWRDEDIKFAIELADALLAQFQDNENGGFFFTAHDQEELIHRPKPTMDDALPSGNGTAASALLRLGHLLGKTEYVDAAYRTTTWARGLLEKAPAFHCNLLTTLEDFTYPPEMVILRGPAEDANTWRRAITDGYKPWREIYYIPYANSRVLPEYLPRLVDSETQAKTTAYVCTGLQCSLPIDNLEELNRTLS